MPDDPVDRDPAGVLLGTLTELSTLGPDAWTDGDVTDQAIRLDRLITLSLLVKEAREMIELSLAESMETDDLYTPVGVLRRVERNTSAWRYEGASERLRDDLAMAVASSVAIDVATGEIDPAKRNVAMAAMRKAYEAIPSFSSLKVAGRKSLGLHIGDYRSYSTHYGVDIEPIGDQ